MKIDPTVLQGYVNLLLSPAGIGFLIYMLFRAFNQSGSALYAWSTQAKLGLIFVVCEVWAFVSGFVAGAPTPIDATWIVTTAFTGVSVLVFNQASYALLEKWLPAIGDFLTFFKTGEVPTDSGAGQTTNVTVNPGSVVTSNAAAG